MPEINYTAGERAEIEALVEKHSPTNHPVIGPALAALRPEICEELMRHYVATIRRIAERGIVFRHWFREAGQNGGWEEDDARDFLSETERAATWGAESEAAHKIINQAWGYGDGGPREAGYEIAGEAFSDIMRSSTNFTQSAGHAINVSA